MRCWRIGCPRAATSRITVLLWSFTYSGVVVAPACDRSVSGRQYQGPLNSLAVWQHTDGFEMRLAPAGGAGFKGERLIDSL